MEDKNLILAKDLLESNKIIKGNVNKNLLIKLILL
jgi:hypothetical protein